MIHSIVKNTYSCNKCKSNHTIRMVWIDFYAEGSRLYDDKICLECGKYLDNSGLFLSKESVLEFRQKYNYLFA